MLRRPREAQVIEYLLKKDRESLNCEDLPDRPKPLTCRKIYLGHGRLPYEIGSRALSEWAMVPQNMVDLYWTDRAAACGTTLAIGMSIYGAYFVLPCRVSESKQLRRQQGIEAATRLTWQTVKGHCLRGSETYAVWMDSNSDVWYEIASRAEPVRWAAPFQPIIQSLRARYQRLSCEVMRQVVSRYNTIKPQTSAESFHHDFQNV